MSNQKDMDDVSLVTPINRAAPSADPAARVRDLLATRKATLAQLEKKIQELAAQHAEAVQALHVQNGAKLQLEELLGEAPPPPEVPA